MSPWDRLRRLDDHVLGEVAAPGSAEDDRRRRRLYAAVTAGVLAMVLYLGASGRGWLTFLTDDPWWWLVLVPCLVVAAVRAIRARHR